MSDPTTTCPNCEHMVLTDTPQCPHCGYDFAAREVRPMDQESLPSDGDANEVPCAKCGAAVREHLVRCWNCGHFMRKEMEDSFTRMKALRPKVEFRPLPDWNPEKADDETTIPADPTPTPAAAEPEAATYSLAGGTEQADSDDDDFETGPEIEFELGDDTADDFDFDGAFDDDGTFDEDEADEPAAPPVRKGVAEAPPVRRASSEEPPPRRAAEPSPDHADAVAADSLLDIAMQEEQEDAKRHAKRERTRKKRAAARRKRRAGQAVPTKKRKPQAAAGRYRFWIKDLPLHVVGDSTKVKAKPAALAKPTQTVDLGFGEVGLLVVSYVPRKSSLFGKSPDPAATRKAVVEHLRADGGLDDLPAERHWAVEPEQARDLPFEQPNEYAHETVFGGVPVFGDGKIALLLPTAEDSPERCFLTLSLSQFRRFAKAAGVFGAKEFGETRGIPLTDATEKQVCHYTDQEFEPLVDSTFHVHDEEIDLKVVGRRCQSCGLVVSEDGRKKESIGGKSGKGIGKAKCPKCGDPFGEITLYSVVPSKPKSAARKPVAT